ncbi:hypothetical protein BDN72DRAFT_849401, partial [Pluteus cervinus]
VRNPSEEVIQKYGHHIRHLLFGWRGSLATFVLYLTSSPNITSLAVWSDFRPQEEWFHFFKRLPLVRLSMYPITLLMDNERLEEGPKEAHTLFLCFPQLTHLDLVLELPLPYIPCLKSLPNLRYLSMYLPAHSIRNSSFPDLRNDSPGFKVLVIIREGTEIHEYEESDDDLTNIKDPRVVSCLVPSYVRDWERGARGQFDVYDFGLEILKKRMAKNGDRV